MVTKRQPPPELTYDEQVAIARANLERHIAEAQAVRDQMIAQGIDLEAEFNAWVQANFTREALLEAWREHLTERGKALADELDEWDADITDEAYGGLAR